MVTVFTPVYNRAYIIRNLYESLQRQTCMDFEWVVVNDGSTDNIDELMQEFIYEGKIDIRYFKQENGGKHRAINRGVQEAKGIMFFIVDSDDYLTDDAVEWVKNQFKYIEFDKNFAGLSGCRIHNNGELITKGFKEQMIEASSLVIRYEKNITGDMAEVWKTSIIKKYPFPEIEDEKFVPEALVWNRMAANGLKIRLVNKPLYVCDYLSDGLTASITRQRIKSPLASTLFYSELYDMKLPIKQKFKASINFWRFWFCLKKNKRLVFNWKRIISLPLGFFMYLNDKRA